MAFEKDYVKDCDLFIHTYSTSPLLTYKTIDDCIEKFKKEYENFISEIENINCIIVAHKGTSKMIRGIIEKKTNEEILKSKHKQPDVYKIIGGDVELLSLE